MSDKRQNIKLTGIFVGNVIVSILIALLFIQQGPQGSSGLIGSQGPAGEPGATGPVGNTGLPGSNGEDGVAYSYDGVMIQEDIETLGPIEDSASYALDLITNEGYIALGSALEFAKIGNEVNYPLDGRYVLTSHLDLTAHVWTPLSAPFIGVFDGAGYTISNLIHTPENLDLHVGLFSEAGDIVTEREATFRNFTITDFTLMGEDATGSVVGVARYHTHFENIVVQNTFIRSLNDNAGGVVGTAPNVMSDNGGNTLASFHTVTVEDSIVTATSNSGGVIGLVNQGQFIHVLSINNNIQTRLRNVGGITGFSLGSKFIHVKNTSTIFSESGYAAGITGLEESRKGSVYKHVLNAGRVVSNSNFTGGIIGSFSSASYGWGSFEGVFNTGHISGQNDVAGLIGRMNSPATFYSNNLMNAGLVEGKNQVGGIYGYYQIAEISQISNIYNRGEIRGEMNVGGIFGIFMGNGKPIEQSFYNLYNSGRIEGIEQVGGVIGYINSGDVTIMRNMFNVGEIIVDPTNVTSAGQILGRFNDNLLFYNVYFYWDGESAVQYGVGENNANPFVTIRITDFNRFTQAETFLFKNHWNMDLVWTFEVDSDYPYPVLQYQDMTSVEQPDLDTFDFDIFADPRNIIA
jgi:hypothetical protein